jgi:hypothetical protein
MRLLLLISQRESDVPISSAAVPTLAFGRSLAPFSDGCTFTYGRQPDSPAPALIYPKKLSQAIFSPENAY